MAFFSRHVITVLARGLRPGQTRRGGKVFTSHDGGSCDSQSLAVEKIRVIRSDPGGNLIAELMIIGPLLHANQLRHSSLREFRRPQLPWMSDRREFRARCAETQS